MFKRLLCLTVISLFICLGYVSESYSAIYTMSNFQSFEFLGATSTIGRGINNSGEIVGDYTDGSGINGFRSVGNNVGNLITFNSDFPQWYSIALDINNSGNYSRPVY